MFVLALISLLGQPQFKTLRLCWCEGLPLAALQAIVEAFMSSSPQSEQHLTLMSMNILVLSRWQSLLHRRKHRTKPHLSVSAVRPNHVGWAAGEQVCIAHKSHHSSTNVLNKLKYSVNV